MSRAALRSAATSSVSSWRRASPDSRASSASSSMRLALLSTTSRSSLGDVVVDAAEVVVLEPLAALLAQLLEQLAHALEPLAVAVLEARLHHPPQGRVEVAVVEQVVGDLAEESVGVEVEADLRAVPPGVPDAVDLPHGGTVPGILPM